MDITKSCEILICRSKILEKKICGVGLLRAIWDHQGLESHRAQQFFFWAGAQCYWSLKRVFCGGESILPSSTCYLYSDSYFGKVDPNYSAILDIWQFGRFSLFMHPYFKVAWSFRYKRLCRIGCGKPPTLKSPCLSCCSPLRKCRFSRSNLFGHSANSQKFWY